MFVWYVYACVREREKEWEGERERGSGYLYELSILSSLFTETICYQFSPFASSMPVPPILSVSAFIGPQYVYNYRSLSSTLLLQGSPHLFVVDLCGWVLYMVHISKWSHQNLITNHTAKTNMAPQHALLLGCCICPCCIITISCVLCIFISRGDLEHVSCTRLYRGLVLLYYSLRMRGVISTTVIYTVSYYNSLSLSPHCPIPTYRYCTPKRKGDIFLPVRATLNWSAWEKGWFKFQLWSLVCLCDSIYAKLGPKGSMSVILMNCYYTFTYMERRIIPTHPLVESTFFFFFILVNQLLFLVCPSRG